MELCTASISTSARRSHLSTFNRPLPYHQYATSRSWVSKRRRQSSLYVMNAASTRVLPSSRGIGKPAQTNGAAVSNQKNSALEQLDIERGVCIPFRKYSPEMVRNKVLGSSGSVLSLASRGVEIIWKLGFYWSSLVYDYLVGRDEEIVPFRARQLRNLLCDLGPSFIKAGQVLANRPDIIREDYMSELCILQDDVPPFANQVAFSIIEEELGQPLEQLFSKISSETIAAASLGQVYRATLRETGEDVAIKVQRPGIEPIIYRDLFLFRTLASFLNGISLQKLGCNAELIVDEFGEKLLEELDYTPPDPGEKGERDRAAASAAATGKEGARMRSGGGGEREDEEAAHKLKSMDVNKLEKGGNGSSSSDEDSPHPPRPAVKYHGWRAMPFIIGNETFEKLGTLGTSANLLVYLTQVFHMQSVDAATLLNGLNGTSSLAPIVGAFLSDAYLGRYLALAIATIASLIGMFFLTLTAGADSLHPPDCGVGEVCQKATSYQFAVLFIAFVFMVIGSAGIRPCSMPFGADQFDPHTESGKRGINSFFNWYYFTFTSAMLVSATVIIYVQSNVNWALGLGIPTALMFLASVLFFAGTRLYVRVVPEGSPFTTVVQVFSAAIAKRSLKQPKDPKQDLFDPPHTSAIVTKLAHTDQFRCLDKAAMVASPDEVRPGGEVAANPWRLCTVQQVEEVKCLIRIVPVWSTGIIYYVAVVQQSTYVVFSALQSDRRLGSSFHVPAASFTVFAMLAQTLWIPLYDRILVPRLRKVTGKDEGFSLLQRQGIGIALSTVAMVISAVVEDRRRGIALNQPNIGKTQTGGGISAMSSFWMVPQLMILGLSEAFNLISQIEFYYKEIPEHMRSVAGALAFCNLALGNYLSGFLTTIVNKTTAGGQNWLAQDLNQGRLDLFYWTIAGIGVFNFVYFIICARWYRFKGASN